jgi:DnaJ-class molecular chaperone
LLANIHNELEKLYKKATGRSLDFKDDLRRNIEKALNVMDLKPGATLEKVKRTYRKLAQKYHPDTHPGDKDAEEKMKALNKAYDFLRKNLKEVTVHV